MTSRKYGMTFYKYVMEQRSTFYQNYFGAADRKRTKLFKQFSLNNRSKTVSEYSSPNTTALTPGLYYSQ